MTRKRPIDISKIEVITSPKHHLVYKSSCKLGIRGYEPNEVVEAIIEAYRRIGISLPIDDIKNAENGAKRGYERHIEEKGYKARGYTIIRRIQPKKTSQEQKDKIMNLLKNQFENKKATPLSREEYLDLAQNQVIKRLQRKDKEGKECGGYKTNGTRINKAGTTVKANQYYNLYEIEPKEGVEWHIDQMGLKIRAVDIDKETPFALEVKKLIENYQIAFNDTIRYTINPKKKDKFSFHYLFKSDEHIPRITQGAWEDVGVDILGNEPLNQSVCREINREEVLLVNHIGLGDIKD